MSRHTLVRTTVRLSEELAKRARKRAQEEGRTLTSLIEEGLMRILNDSVNVTTMKNVRIPVSQAKGGLQAGVDLDDSAALLDLMDGR
ncbi:MAG: DUF2191 domain-containing protein [Gammaproteobacteria bacterium]|nr:DUF2191 domain-containing protein [Gammaproteobacteria bacterium]